LPFNREERFPAVTASVRVLNWGGRHSPRPSANSGIRHSGGADPLFPRSCVRVSTVTRTSRRAPANIKNASGNSASTADKMLSVKPLEP